MKQLATASGLPASPLCFGAMQFGGNADEAMSRAMYEACRAKGVNFFDTAHSYTDGASETLLGQFAQDERAALLIATKANYAGGASRDNILTTFDESRQRLGMDMVDLLYMHRWDESTPLEETFETLASLKEKGLIRYVGVSNYAAWQVMKAIRVAGTFGIDVDVLQPMYNLVKRQAEVEILPMCVDQGVAVCPYSPLGGGLLTGKYAKGGSGRLHEDDRYTTRYGQEWMHTTAASLPDLADEAGVDPATLAIAWAARHNAVMAPIISARSVCQLAPSLDAMGFTLDRALYDRMSALSQTPAPATDRLEEA